MLELMIDQNIPILVDAYGFLLNECTRRKAFKEGKRLHGLIIKARLDSNVFLGNTLVNMYAKCGAVTDAHNVFNSMAKRNVFSWTAMISAYSTNGQHQLAINLFQRMLLTDTAPNKVTFVVVLKACTSILALQQGSEFHSAIIENGLDSDVMIGSALVDMYSKCGLIRDAYQAFDRICQPNVVCWNAMIGAYVQHNLGTQALDMVEQMKQRALEPDIVTYVLLLKACASKAALEEGMHFHLEIINHDFESNVNIGNALINMYAKCGQLEYACRVFNNMQERDAGSWNAMVAGYTHEGLSKEALDLYEQMKQEGVPPDIVTYVLFLQASASAAGLQQGKQFHLDIIKSGFDSNILIASSLIDMYAKCGCLEDARLVFDSMIRRDVVSWNVMIAAYVYQGLGKEALDLYEDMKQECVHPNIVTYVFLLKACASIAALELGKQFHSEIIHNDFELDVRLGTTLVDMYAKCGFIRGALQVFNDMPERNEVSWNVMIMAYAQQNLGNEALDFYEQMKKEDVQPGVATYVALLKACASIGALEQGKQFHVEIIRRGFGSDMSVMNCLIDMYARCGCIEDASQVFQNMQEKNVVAWNAIIAAYAKQGFGHSALSLLEQMLKEDLEPDEVTYVSVLSACSRSGLVNEGCQLFNSMSNRHGIMRTIDHYVCMVDLLGRAGCLVDAECLISKMPIQPNIVIWTTLLGAAKMHGNLEIASRAFDHAVNLEPENGAPYVLLSNMYAAADLREDAEEIRKRLCDAGVTKNA